MMPAVTAAAMPVLSEPCPACAAGHDRVLLRLDFLEGYPERLQLVRCRACGTERIDPHPPAAAMAAHYDEAYYREGYLPYVARRRADFRRRLQELEQLPNVRRIRQRGGRPRCLDVGAGVGLFCLEAQAAGWQATAVEPSAAARRLAGEWGLDMLADWPAAAGAYDVVALWDVLGHVDDPCRLLAAAAGQLAGDGRVAVKVPNFRSSWHRVRGWMSGRRRVNLLHAPTVIWRPHRAGLRLLLERHGFTVESVTTVREPDLIPLSPRWRGVRLATDLLDGLLDNRQEMVIHACRL